MDKNRKLIDAILNIEQSDGILKRLADIDKELAQHGYDLQNEFRRGFMLAESIVKSWAQECFPLDFNKQGQRFKRDKLISELQERAEIAEDELDKLKQSVSEHSSAGVWGSIYYEVSEDEIQKEISDYKNNVKLEASTFTDDEIRDFCIKSLVSYKVGLQSYTNPENIKPPVKEDKKQQ